MAKHRRKGSSKEARIKMLEALFAVQAAKHLTRKVLSPLGKLATGGDTKMNNAKRHQK